VIGLNNYGRISGKLKNPIGAEKVWGFRPHAPSPTFIPMARIIDRIYDYYFLRASQKTYHLSKTYEF